MCKWIISIRWERWYNKNNTDYNDNECLYQDLQEIIQCTTLLEKFDTWYRYMIMQCAVVHIKEMAKICDEYFVDI